MKRITILLVTLLALLVAACTSEAASPSATEPQPTPTVEPTPEATEVAGETAAGLPSFEEGAGDLAAILPTEVGGVTINYQSASGEAVLGSEGMTPETQAFLDRIGADPADISSAFGFAFDVESESGLSIVAFRVAGADESRLRDEFVAVLEQEGDVVGEETNVGGKTVLGFGDTPDSQGYVYVKNDVVFIVGGSPESLIEEALSKLP